MATFLYCVLVVLTIRRGDEEAFVPHLSVTLGVLLAVISMGVLIYFIHHVVIAIQANQVVARVGRELIDVLESLFLETIGDAPAGVPRRARGLPSCGVSITRPSQCAPRATATCNSSMRMP